MELPTPVIRTKARKVLAPVVKVRPPFKALLGPLLGPPLLETLSLPETVAPLRPPDAAAADLLPFARPLICTLLVVRHC